MNGAIRKIYVPNYNKARSLGYYVQELRRQLLRLRKAHVLYAPYTDGERKNEYRILGRKPVRKRVGCLNGREQ